MPHWSRRTTVLLETAIGAIVLLILLARLAVELHEQLASPWSGARLAFSDALAHGIDIYPTTRAGVVTGDMYGPVTAVFYLPALLVPGVSGKLFAGQMLSVLVMLVPAFALIDRTLRAESARLATRLFAGLALIALLLLLPSTRCQLRQIHSDAPCLGLGLWSYLVLSDTSRPEPRRWTLAAVLVALATLTKPLGAFVAFAEVLLLARSAGMRVAAGFAVACLLAGAFGSVLLAQATGTTLDGIWFNAFVVPGRQHVDLSARALVRGMAKLSLPLVLLGVATLAPALATRRSLAGLRAYASPPVALELWFIALALVPISYLARAKVGGDVNSFHAHYFACVATAVVVPAAISRIGGVSLRALALGALAGLVAPLGRALPVSQLLDDSHDRLAAYLRRHDDVFFPWHALETLEANGTYFHHPDGLHSRELSRLPLSHDEFFEHAPAHPSYIVLPRESPGLPTAFIYADLVSRYYPDYVAVLAPPELRALNAQVFAPRDVGSEIVGAR